MAPAAVSPLRATFDGVGSLTTTYDDTLVFYLNGTRVVLDDVDPEATLLEYLRGIGLTGTKLGCGEGGCGACTVVVSQLNPTTGKIYHASVNACLAPLASVDGKHVITVEGIGNAQRPHPTQERIARGNGSQCGFCTPGIVMSLYALLRNNDTPTEHDIEEAFDGNLCRCTGYRTILDAAQTFSTEAAARQNGAGCFLSRANGGSGCCQDKEGKEGEKGKEQAAGGGCCKDKDSSGGGGCCKDKKTEDDGPIKRYTPPGFIAYEPDTELIFPPALRKHTFQPLSFGNKRKRWYRPATLEQLLELKQVFPQAKIIGGSSETQIEIKFKALQYPVSVFVGDIPELRGVVYGDDYLEIGGNVTLTDLELLSAAAARDRYGPVRGQVLAAIHKQLQFFAGRQIRNVGTPAGNLITASPISDLNPVLMAAGATIVAKAAAADGSGITTTEIPMSSFFVGYRRTALPADAVLAAIRIPLTLATGEYFRAYKQAKRKDDDIAIVTAAMRVRVDPATGVVTDCNLVYGGMAATTVAAKTANAFLLGRRLAELPTLEGTMNALETDFNLPFSVPGGMASYRRALALSLFYRFYHEVMVAMGKAEIHAEVVGGSSSSNPSEESPEASSPEASSPEASVPEDGGSSSGSGSSVSEDEPAEALVAKGVTTDVADVADVAAVEELERAISIGAIDHDAAKDYEREVLGKANPHLAALKQTTGEAQYVDDIPPLARELHGCLVLSRKAHARILSIDYEPARALPGVVDIIDRHSMPSDAANHWGAPNFDEVFLAEDEVHTVGQPIAMVVATTAARAAEAARAVRVEYEELPAIFTMEEAIAQNSFFSLDRRLRRGEDPDTVFPQCDHVFSGSVRMGGQEHFYLETNAVVAVPKAEDGEMEVFSSTQNPNETQVFVAQVCGVQANKVVVRAKRLGGGFGGKETRSVQLTAIASLAARKTRRPVRCMLTREEDMVTSGQRHPFLAYYTVGVSRDGKLQALKLDIYNNAGWTWDLSAAVVERAMTHSDGCYRAPNVSVRGRLCRTNTMSNTAFRGFGGPQGLFIAETYMTEVADRLGLSVDQVRAVNLYRPLEETPFGQALKDWHVPVMLEQVQAQTGYAERRAAAAAFNAAAANRWRKRGLALVPTKFGISFTALWLNQAGALVHIYHDGSVLVAHGGTEMGQGLHTKMCMVAAQALQVPLESVFISETATNTVANASATAASAASDLNGYAIYNACAQLNERLAPYRERVRAKDGGPATMQELAHAAYHDRVNLSAQGFYRTPEIGYSWDTNRGQMFFYFTQGVAAAEVEIDTLTGTWTCLRADVLMDVGRTINPAIDYGQIQGAFVQGMGLFTMEESLWLRSGPMAGHLFTRGPGAYKIPGFRDVPQEFNVQLLKGVEWSELRTIARSRGVGEPPLFMGSCVFFAIRDALVAARAQHGVVARTAKDLEGDASLTPEALNADEGLLRLQSPATPERIRLSCADPIMERTRVAPKPDEKSFFISI